jgi:DNA polymerase-4
MLRARSRGELARRFGKFGGRLFELARGIDEHAVTPHQPRRSLSAETTFETDLALAALNTVVDELAARVWRHLDVNAPPAHTVVLKLKTSEFRLITRSLTPPQPPASATALATVARELLTRVALPARTRYRLAGVGLANFRAHTPLRAQSDLF